MIPDPVVRSSVVAYHGRFPVEVHEIEMANGVIATREVLRHPGAVCMVPVAEDGALLLVTQHRLAAGRRLLELPAGTLEPGEDPRDTAARELQEEVGFRAQRIEPLGGFFVAPGYTSEYIHLYVCSGLNPSRLDGDEDEDIEVEVRTLAQAMEAIDRGEISDAKSIIGILRFARLLAAVV